MGPSELEMGVGGDLGLRGGLLNRTSWGPGVRVFISGVSMYVRVRDRCGKTEELEKLTPSLENPIQERSAFFGNGTTPS